MRIIHATTLSLVALTALAAPGCAVPDDEAVFRTTLIGGGGDDFGAAEEDDGSAAEMPACIPTTTPPGEPITLGCPGVDLFASVQAANAQDAAEMCDRLYGDCCDAACAEWDAEADAMCALDVDDAQLDDMRDSNTNPGEWACGCDCVAN